MQGVRSPWKGHVTAGLQSWFARQPHIRTRNWWMRATYAVIHLCQRKFFCYWWPSYPHEVVIVTWLVGFYFLRYTGNTTLAAVGSCFFTPEHLYCTMALSVLFSWFKATGQPLPWEIRGCTRYMHPAIVLACLYRLVVIIYHSLYHLSSGSLLT